MRAESLAWKIRKGVYTDELGIWIPTGIEGSTLCKSKKHAMSVLRSQIAEHIKSIAIAFRSMVKATNRTRWNELERLKTVEEL